jgi:hypothetical protein
MNRQIKISSNEGGVFTGNNNRISFNIPEGKYYDLSKAYLNLVSSIPVTSATGPVLMRARMSLDDGTQTAIHYKNSALIKHVRFDNEMGSVENIQRSDILSNMMADYSIDDDAVESAKYQDLFRVTGTSQTQTSMFSELQREGNIVSKNLIRQPVRIKLSEIMNFWKTKQYNGVKYGKSRLEIELNLDKVKVYQGLNFSGQSGSGTGPGSVDSKKEWEQDGLQHNHFLELTATIGSDHNSAKKLQIGAGAVATPFNRPEDQGVFWVGQQIMVKGAAANGAPIKAGLDGAAGIKRTIVAIDYDRGQGNLGMTGSNQRNAVTITLDEAITTTALTGTQAVKNIQCCGVDATSSGYQIDYGELVLEEIGSPDMDGAEAPISYTSYTTEEFTTAKTKNFQRIFSVEPEAITLYVGNPYFDASNTGSITSFQNGIESYRIRIDNKDASGRLIQLRNGTSTTNDSLHIQKQHAALANSGKKLKNLLEQVRLTGHIVGGSDTFNKRVFDAGNTLSTLLISQILPRTSEQKQVQLTINCEGANGVNALVLFKEIERVI